jgi:phenylalanyl-tRNA synthetase beta chain
LIPALVEATVDNLKHERSVRFFEIAPVFLPASGAPLPDQPSTLGLVVAGSRDAFNRFTSSASELDQLDFFDVKGMVETALGRVGAKEVRWVPATHPALHPVRTAEISAGGQTVGIAGELRPDLVRTIGLEETRVAVAEIDLAALRKIAAAAPGFVATVPRFLPVEQDFAVVVDHERPAADVERALRSGAGPLATDVVLFDVYAGEQLGSGKKSLAFRVTFTAPDRALTDGELGKVRKRIERTLTQQVGGTLRA